MKISTRKTILDVVTYILLIGGSVIMIAPFLWMVATAFKIPADQFTKTLIPNPITLQNFSTIWDKMPDRAFPYMMFNSFKIAALATFGQLLTCAMGAFAFSAVRFKGRDLLFTLLLITMLIPSQVALIPNFIVFGWMHLIGSQWPLILPAFWGGAFGIFLLRQYFLTIPHELAEAARVDGASLLQIFWKIYIPNARPALAALAIFVFLGNWNDLLHPLVYLPTNAKLTTLTVGLALFQTQFSHRHTVLMAGALISIIPIIVVFFFAQKHFIEGISLTGIKR